MCRGFKILKKIAFLLLFILSACESQEAINVDKEVTDAAFWAEIEEIDNQETQADLWRYISSKHTLKARNSKDLYWHIKWFKDNPDYLERVTKRAGPYLHLVVQEVEKAGLPIEVALLPIVESAYYPFSYSHGTASGLWQFIPGTGKLYGLKQNYWVDERRSVIHSTRAAVRYLKNLHTLFKGDWLLALASYNSGPGRVQRAIKKNKAKGKKADFWHISLPKETEGYVPRLLAVAELIKNPGKYGQTITFVANQPQVESVHLYSQLDLSLIAQWTGLSLDQIYTLNPDLNRWATPDTTHYELLLPIDKVVIFKQARANYPKKKQLNYKRYTVKSGDSLNKLAKKFNSSVAYIKSINHLNGTKIQRGQKIIIPIPKKADNYYTLSKSQRKIQRFNAKKHGKKVTHKVIKGDSLWLISTRYGVPTESIIKWNHLANATKELRIGQKLIIWQVPKLRASQLENITKIGVNVKRTIVYRVRKGDNLSRIAHKFGVLVSQLRKWNKLSAKKPLKIGKKLKIIKPIVKP
ncbi:lytic transglycosylase [Bathymodiolus thermophilus thioautotrophic gill symbiont]|uniref:Lytic transglycosylase n=1 Tax=Bathymodiolus thermophilus thioautotrophic gill symbiont TaxID=2360 RepID=A0A1J5TXJ5_9GAMM|nr:lytic transglycosylase [Bathymodiolus thermophilus thioautotrophic gill symbiont]